MQSTNITVKNTPYHCSGVHKNRLLIGEGNFSFAQALINKHDAKAGHTENGSLGKSIVATEYKDSLLCDMCKLLQPMKGLKISDTSNNKDDNFCDHCVSTVKRVEELKKKGVAVYLKVDAEKLHEMSAIKDKRFQRIHWNCPHDGSQFKKQTLPKIIDNFFKSCIKLQSHKDRIHITLAQPPGKKDFYQGYIYNIAHAAVRSGYKIVKKRHFGSDRYPGYQHLQTKKNEKASVTDEGIREFVFQQVSSKSWDEAAAKLKEEKRYNLFGMANKLTERSEKECDIFQGTFYGESRLYFDCSTDQDSSDYESLER
ncbi:DUF2431 domain-containing protein [Chlamydiales bacterium]|nr:DUF2431 domain-containing protein [Chlamydiales bacterium]